ncbi:anaerobic ribonucleoside-triphosphate reductase activating protein [Desulfuromonas thiophila]|uniref:Pyruvate formate lyase activating enzyme n=1 Tax=Desulfuromonas thiophila TaxID=57664 RepID=A0A1G7F3U8_9BACT|nr:anaerobic ribonucleoside-triphosphate reductase activating protein [Desulfuromonas thiophila]SDE70205.1 pyruvate formate lyase activating enzyme [Desulfuromonas thiophila]
MFLQVGGITRCTTIDFPDQLAAVVYCQGCPWRCSYCHNADLIPSQGRQSLDWRLIRVFLAQRRGRLDGVVFSGGEPTAQPMLHAAMEEVKELGMKVGLHTNGAYPAHLKKLLPLCDWVGLDIKAPFEDYERITGVPASGLIARESVQLLRLSSVPHQFRTTLDPWLLQEGRLEKLQSMVRGWGGELVLQPLR